MEAKEYLNRIRGLDRRITSLIGRQDELKALASRCTASLSAAPGGGGDGRSLEKTVQKIVMLERQIDEEIDRLVELKAETLFLISGLNDVRLESLLEMRYVDGKKWTEIQCALELSATRITRLHQQALNRFQTILDEKGPEWTEKD